MAIKPLLLGSFFICALLAIILLIPFVRVSAPNIATTGVSPMPSLQRIN
ncbi:MULTISPECIES: hypothetical protein [unclassified Rhizobium]|nr:MULTISPECIES: hypothetical protein [unclassified Rhizobium]EJL57999.1 hypothetical protein PMI09_00706 [Rhizobium sp. CF122]MBB3394302.1 hypothetical protein [Rhizobium sp. BK060]MBB4169660.1 hypothetical protein [Rhizobium sp. BK538]TCM75471.1 hypothetical protein EV291_1133 [Rhizobium sp. BK068]